MGAEAALGVMRAPGRGPGWARVAAAVAQAMPPAEIDRIWVFAPVRRDEREWGTAVIARRGAGARRRVYTASYLLVTRGRERGQARVVVEEVGESPEAVVHDVVAGVRRRAGEPDPPVEIVPEVWFGADGDEPAPED